MTGLIRGLMNITQKHKGGVVTIGNFDGVHLGHKALIEKIKNYAKSYRVPSIAVIFEPQPAEYFAREGIPRLTRWREKYCALAAAGVDYVLTLRFNAELASWRAETFVEQVLVDGLSARHVVIGDDFRFGYQREGSFAFLEEKGAQYGFAVERMQSVMLGDARISSTRIRHALAQGDNQLAESLLGRPYSMMGRVVHGDKLGRQLGFPTANIFLHRPVAPVQGIYIVRMQGIEKHALPGVANIGIRPTVGGKRNLLEVYLFNFNSDIYGRHVSVEFGKKLRDEERYDNLELLKNAIANDVKQAQDYFKERGEL